MDITYNEMYARFINKEITEEIWIEFCQKVFDMILVENKEVFVRLKFR